MNIPEIKEGVAIRYPGTGPALGYDRAHTHVVITNPDDKETVLLVSICSFDRFSDQTCVLEADNTWEPIVRKSYVAYHHSKRASVKNIMTSIGRQEITYLGPVPPEIFERIKAGVTVSKQTPEVFMRMFVDRQPQLRRQGRVLRSNPPKS
jgi:hypothetical protein